MIWGVLAMVLAAAVAPSAARPAPQAFVTEQYGLTFPTPPGSYYCPLPKDWVGSDHGTVMFLARAVRCEGAGFPSSGRAFEPTDVARVEVFYSYAPEPGDVAPAPCRRVGTVQFLARARSLCRQDEGGLVVMTVTADYQADEPAQAVFTLATPAVRLARDLPVFRAMLRLARTCTATWRDPSGKSKPFTTGKGPACPADACWF